ncbi:FAS1-like dehydratase domain-containing protein [Nocardia arthritidis]|uniref:FAS1-like dehydratase domain-containing protein n=1 Tax=Nocardia arthritidis TaxID=228602 RepID=A0A6G9YME5_9NOCA|nr:MaoC family dehydratase N-terminal domain-containing protein [Nocardia arthritidis]QIS14206.1 hypothetical protein F5544_31835 [Nocardia arthritidis]
MTDRPFDLATWESRIESFVSDLNAHRGRSAPAPLFTEGPYSFPLVRTRVTEELIRQFARADGDMNPLWSDPRYAAASPWGSVIAPPVFEACFGESPSKPKPPQVPGWNAMQAGAFRRYFEPFRPGDTLTAEDTWHGIEEKTRPGKSYRLFVQTSERSYRNQHGRTVCTVTGRQVATAARPDPAAAATGGPDFSGRRRRKYTSDELDAIRRDYERELSGEARRGAHPRYWEDVDIGESIPAILKGPYDVSDAAAFAGALGLCSGFAAKWQEIAPDLGRRPGDPDTGHPHHPIDWHLQDTIAQQSGMPYALAFGTHMEMMLLHPVTNWMSDFGFVVQADTQLRSPLLLGEVSRTTAQVTNKLTDNEHRVVDLEVVSRTLDGTTYAHATVRVALPSRFVA